MKPTSRLMMDFARRMVEDLPTNNVLRGSWAEQLVAHFLDIPKLPSNWSYNDMRDAEGRDISVKHSVGRKPTFSVAMNKWAWDSDLRLKEPATEGWFGGESSPFQYWCHVYVFAWLKHETSEPDLDVVLDSEQWRFAVLPREEMYSRFAPRGEPQQKSVGLATLTEQRFVAGSQLRAAVSRIPLVTDALLVPPRIMVPWRGSSPGVPTKTVAPELVPEGVVDGNSS